ncbi:MAG: MBL fold metallo-hydrolase [Candidatus Sericytochromatia bacterium]|nr:MBL fold metallo-hydrolase [Candidatus Sericytochromatia bacterium]
MAHLDFLGATGTVTGSKYLLTANGQRILIDCGLYQGPKVWREQNLLPLPFAPADLNAIVLTHAHLDHTGYLPRLVADGFTGPVYCTAGTADLLHILLPDSAHLMEEAADYKSRHGDEAKTPLYGAEDARQALKRLHSTPFHLPFAIAPGVQGYYRRAGHILGAATLELRITEGAAETILVASGDLGRAGMYLLAAPEPVYHADALLIESTYGNRRHAITDPESELAALIDEMLTDSAVMVIPAFAVGRTQELLAVLKKLEDRGRIPAMPIYVDSPMAIEATEMLARHADDLSPQAQAHLREGDSPIACRLLSLSRTKAESIALNAIKGPAIIISASGMANAGRTLHHLRKHLPDPRAIICFCGFQADGTLGRTLADGAAEVRIFGHAVPVRAKIRMIGSLSAHADQDELVAWARQFKLPPAIHIVHGEDDARAELARLLQEAGMPASIPTLGSRVELPMRPIGGAGPTTGSRRRVAREAAAAPVIAAAWAQIAAAPPLPPVRLTIGVMGSADDESPEAVKVQARLLGRAIAQSGCTTLTGACPGLPHAAILGAKDAGGLTVGISPALSRAEHVGRYKSPSDGYDILVYTGSGLMGREVTNIRSSDIIVIAGGRSGTLGEFAIAYDEGKLIGILTGTGGLADQIDTVIAICNKDTGARLIYDDDPERLVTRLLKANADFVAATPAGPVTAGCG